MDAFGRRIAWGWPLAALLLACGGWPSARAQVYKCLDASGHVTYQQEPCPGPQKGSRVEIKDAVVAREAPEREAQWATAVRDRTVQAGMPKDWVRKALGAPAEARAARRGENAIEVWGYPAADGRTLRIGFVAGNVAWFRHETAGGAPVEAPVPAPATGPATAPVAAPVATSVTAPVAADSLPPPETPQIAAAAPKVPNPRELLQAGTACSEVFQRLGTPDRREIRELGASGFETRHIYEPGPGDPSTRTTVVCVAGKVVAVERNPP